MPGEREWHENPKPGYLKLKAVFESARQKWRNKPEKELRAGMLEPILAELGFSFRTGKKAGDDKAEPDYFLFERGQNSRVKSALAFCLAYPWDRYLDGKDYTRDPEMFRYFWLMFRAHAFQKRTVTVEGQERATTFLEQLLEGSQQYAKELGERLKERVFNHIFPHFAEGFVEYRRNLPALWEQPRSNCSTIPASFDSKPRRVTNTSTTSIKPP